MEYQEGCFVSINSRRSVVYRFESDGEVIRYLWNTPNEFEYYEESINKCFVIKYYRFMWDRYIYSATLIKGDE